MSERQNQIADQCKAVAHLATELATVATAHEKMIRDGAATGIWDIIGERSAHQMEVLGDILNGMDAVNDAEDKWMEPVFAAAHKLWPGA